MSTKFKGTLRVTYYTSTRRDYRDKLPRKRIAESGITSEMIEAGANALLLSGYGSEYKEVMPKQAVLEVLEAMGLVSHQDVIRTNCAPPM